MIDHQFDEDFQPVLLPDYKEKSLEDMRAAADAFYDRVKQRHTVREFSDRPVPRDIIEKCLLAAGTAPNGANHQPWHFSAISNPEMKSKIRVAAEEEELSFYEGRAGEEWLRALKPIGTDPEKPFLETAPWLISIFGQRRSIGADGQKYKNYYVPESVSIATGFLLLALHEAGLVSLTHTPNPMSFLTKLCDRPSTDKPYILLVVGYPAADARIPKHAMQKKPLQEISTFFE
ncbi:nitroreductase family protein [Maritalea sp.]|uniref:nitroreductase family protein n=1 Tax=Maritalea sp. TaxID=2003361 RepID=UPI003EF6843C